MPRDALVFHELSAGRRTREFELIAAFPPGQRLLPVVLSMSMSMSVAAAAAEQIALAPAVIVSATRFAENVDRLPINATVIDAAEIARSTARTVPELVGMKAGILMRDLYGNDAALSSIDMRGFGASSGQNVLVLVDGRPLNDIDMSGLQWASLPLESIERIEVLRGSGSVQYGDQASAGVINVVTRHPARARNGARGSVRFGSWNTRDLEASFNAFGAQAGLYGYVRNYESSGYRDNNESRQSNAMFSANWSGERADTSLRVALDRQGIRLPGARMVQPSAGIDLLTTDRRGAATPLDYAQRDGTQVSIDVRREFGPGEFALGLGYRDKAQRSYYDFGGFPDYRDIDLDVWSLQPRYRVATQAFGMRHSIVAGFDIARWDYTLLKANAASNVGQPINRVTASQDNDAFYVLDAITVSDGVVVSGGYRRERRRLSAWDVHDPAAPGGLFGSGAPAGQDRLSATAYEAGVRVAVARGVDVIARTGRSFRFANVDEIYEFSPAFTAQFQFLRPQKARTHELGVAFGGAAPWLRASAFRMDVTDEIHLDPFSTGVGNRNMPPLRRNGLEVEARYAPVKQLQLSGAYTYTRAKFTEGDLNGVAIAGRTVPLVPRHKLDVNADLQLGPATRLRAFVQSVGEQVMENDEGNTFDRRIPAYTTADLKLQHRIGAVTASLGVNNLFDRKYYAYAVRSQFVPDRFNAYPLPERSFWVGIEVSGL
jgi:iron complex outermembrane receptor protein